MFLMWEFFPKRDVDHYNAVFIQVVVAPTLLAIAASIMGPWTLLRGKSASWSPSAMKAAPLVGLASVVGGLSGFLAVGIGGFAVLESLVGPIGHNSLLGVPVVLGAVIAGVGCAGLGPLLVIRAAGRRPTSSIWTPPVK